MLVTAEIAFFSSCAKLEKNLVFRTNTLLQEHVIMMSEPIIVSHFVIKFEFFILAERHYVNTAKFNAIF